MIHLEQRSFNLRYCAPYLLSGLLCTGCLKLPEFRDDTGGATDAARPLDRSLDAQVSDADQSPSDMPDMTRLDLAVDASSSPEDMSPTDPQDLALDGGVDMDVTDMDEPDAQVNTTPRWLSLTAREANRIVVSNDDLRIEWSEVTSFAPSSVTRNGAEFLWEGVPNSNIERFAGILLYNHLVSHNAISSVNVLHSGPGVVRLSVDWQAVAANDSRAEGTTTWTLHDDGRLFRDERFTINHTWSRGDVLVGYHAVPIDRVRTVESDERSTPQPRPSQITGNYDFVFARGADLICASGDDGAILFAGYNPSPEPVGLRYTWNGINQTVRSLKLQFDWVWEDSNTPTVRDWSGVLLTSLHENCSVAADFERAHRAPPQLRVISGGRVSPWEGDDGEDGYYERGGFYTVTSDDDSLVTLAFDTPTAPSITLWVTHSSESAPRVIVNDDDVLAEHLFVASRGVGPRGSESGWFVHIRRQIEPSETLTIGF